MAPWYMKLASCLEGAEKAALPQDDWQAAGYMEQRRRLGWHRRYCVLSNGKLYISKNSSRLATVGPNLVRSLSLPH